jgi:hypothetical protein
MERAAGSMTLRLLRQILEEAKRGKKIGMWDGRFVEPW